jgi:hypothetical protein
MAVAPTFVAGREQCFQQIDRLTNSHSLRGAESLCKLLRYLAEHSLAHPPTHVKEYQIATEVFGRSAHFDPQADSTVRVQAGRLRTKLAEYYAMEGVDDPIVVKLPKGSYALSFELHVPQTTGESTRRLQTVAEGGSDRRGIKYWRLAVLILSIGLLGALASVVGLVWSGKGQRSAVATTDSADSAALRTFWKPFLSGPEPPLVIFSNAAFVGRPENGMRYFNSAHDAKATVHDHYTGVGEVLAVHALDQVSLDDARNKDLVFVGSPSENLTLLDIPGTQEFVFQRLVAGPRQGDLAIINRHPQGEEAGSFLASRSNDPLTEDYAVVGLVPGIDPARHVLILAGTTTFGTQGAVEFVSSPDSVKKLLERMSNPASGQMQPFEALVRVKITRGVPVDTELVAVRVR